MSEDTKIILIAVSALTIMVVAIAVAAGFGSTGC